jgi:hypothetical protein
MGSTSTSIPMIAAERPTRAWRSIVFALALAAAACGGRPGGMGMPDGGGDDDMRDDSGMTGDDSGMTGDDGGGGGDGGGDGGGGDGGDGGGGDGGGGGGDGGTMPCAAPQDPTQTYALSGSAAFGDSRWPRMAYVGGSIWAIGPFSNDSGWYKWAGGGWSFVAQPWPSGQPKPFIIDIYDLPNGHLLFQVQLTYAPNNYEYALIDFDGTTMSAPVIIPAALRGFVREATRTVDGTYHLLTSAVPGDPPWAMRSFAGGAWSQPTPVPIPQNVSFPSVSMTSLTNGRIVVVYAHGHLYEMHRKVNEPWSTVVDLTPSWAVGATDPLVVGARGGGVAIAVTGVSNSYRFPYYWDSADGVTYSAGEYTNPATQLQDQSKFLALDCIAQPVLVIRRQNSIMLLKRGMPAAWPPLATGASYYSAGGSAAITPDGKTYFGWSYTLSDGSKYTTLLATP